MRVVPLGYSIRSVSRMFQMLTLACRGTSMDHELHPGRGVVLVVTQVTHGTGCAIDAVYWVVPYKEIERHAMCAKPGALPAGAPVRAICGLEFSVPISTPYREVPASRAITNRCADCGRGLPLGACEIVWDF